MGHEPTDAAPSARSTCNRIISPGVSLVKGWYARCGGSAGAWVQGSPVWSGLRVHLQTI